MTGLRALSNKRQYARVGEDPEGEWGARELDDDHDTAWSGDRETPIKRGLDGALWAATKSLAA